MEFDDLAGSVEFEGFAAKVSVELEGFGFNVSVEFITALVVVSMTGDFTVIVIEVL